MFKIFIKSILIYLFFTTIVFSEVIKNVDISGNKRISKETILVLGNIQEGEDFDNDRINNSLKKLYETNFFKDIKINLEDGLLKITVTENPIIENIELTGIKNKTVIKAINDGIELKDRMSFTENQLEKDINFIDNLLKSNGYYFADLQSSLIKNEELNSIRLKINIDLGKRARIKNISFIGDKKIKDKKLLEVIASEEHRFWKIISNKVYLNESIINLDKRLLENYYKNLGYMKVEVLNSFAEFSNEGYFNLIFNINSGERYFFNDFNLNLPEDYDLKDFNKITKIFQKLKGKRYSLDNLELILDEIDRIASAKLYDFIDATVNEEIIDKNKINFTFNVVDSQKFYVERINILGNFTTVEEVVRNQLIVDEGDPLNTLLYNKSLDQIKSLGIFKSVKGKIKDGTNQNTKEIDFVVEEKATGEISLAAGVGTSGSTIGGGINEKNFLGKGINLATDLELSEESVKGQFVYSKPNFAYTDNTLFASVRSTTTDYLTDYGYKVSNAGFSIGTEFEQYENLFFNPAIDLNFENLETNTTASNTLKKQEGTYEDFYFNYGLNYDLRDSPYRPTSGNKTQFFQKLPIVSGKNEISNTFIFTQYKRLNRGSDMVGKASLYLEAVNSLDGSDVRISKRAQIPYNRLRGFERGKVGPVDSNDYIGGNYVTALNLATDIPGLLSTVENIDFTYFIDVANVWGVDYDSSINESNFIRSSTGVGINLLTPIGPLSFSFSQPITKKSTDKTETFRFNLGTTF